MFAQATPIFGSSFQLFRGGEISFGHCYMEKLVWEIRLFCAHCICADMQPSQVCGAEQVPNMVVCTLLGCLTLFYSLWCKKLLNPPKMQGYRVGTGVSGEVGEEEATRYLQGLWGKRAP